MDEEEKILKKLAEAIDEESVIEYYYIDDDETIMVVMYSSWSGMELFAIVDSDFDLVVKGISGCDGYDEEFGHFNIWVNSTYFDENLVAANALSGVYNCIVGFRGEILVDFQQRGIGWDEKEKAYITESGRLIKAEGIKEIR